MKLQISRDPNGRVTISNPATGKAEVIVTTVIGRPLERALAEVRDLPAHHWSRAAA
jgi:hypothetical protein